MEIYLKAKHWQIFTLLMGVPFVLQIILIANYSFDMMIVFTPALTVLYIVVFFGWFWAIGTRLNRKLPSTVNLNLNLFKVFLAIPIIYIFGISIYMSMVAMGLIESDSSPIFAMSDIINVIFPVHIFSMFCIFYSMWFTAKTIKSIEFKRAVSFSEFAGEFFLLWFFPIGIWIIQPKINKIIEHKD
jgi:membrane-associated HD superfamily phosphohydrolase